MIAHHVLFWLKADITPAEKEAFRGGLQSLENIGSVSDFHIGIPAPIERAVADNSYTFSLLLFFEDMPAHDASSPTRSNRLSWSASAPRLKK